MTPAPVPAGVLRPSNAYRWGNCPNSWVLEAQFPEDEGPEAREGTAAHHYATEAALGTFHEVGSLAPNGHPIDAAMVEGGNVFAALVMSTAALASPTALLRVESRVFAHASIHPRVEGTPDAYLLDGVARVVHVFDYKYGFGGVDPFRLPQLICYLAGVWEGSGYTREDVASWTVHFHIVQPRHYTAEGPVKTWPATGAEMWALIDDWKARAERADDITSGLKVGPWCKHCTAIHVCEPARAAGGFAMDFAGRAIPAHLPPEALGLMLKLIGAAKAHLEALETGLEQEALASITNQGVRVPFWEVGHADTKERWNRPVAEVLAMGDALGVKLAKAREPVTPAQARKLLAGVKVDPAVISSYRVRPQGKRKLVPVDDNTAAKTFGTAAPIMPLQEQ